MRRVLVDHAGRTMPNIEAVACSGWRCRRNWPSLSEKLDQVQQIDDLLKKLETVNPRQARVVELRYFGGLNFEEIGGLLQLTSRTVKTDWALARIWLLDNSNPVRSRPMNNRNKLSFISLFRWGCALVSEGGW